jgi:hypothetical protein
MVRDEGPISIEGEDCDLWKLWSSSSMLFALLKNWTHA